MFRLALSAILVLPVTGQTPWNYNQCDLQYGPFNWTGACKTGVQGTPINLCGARAFPSPAPTWGTITGYDALREGNATNNGKTIEVGFNANPSMASLQLGNLAQIVGRSTESTTFTWNLAQLHFHWGRTGKNDEGSEHYLFGQRYPIELHFVHYNSKYSNLGAAVGSGNSDALLVVGIIFTIGPTDTPLMLSIANAAPTLLQTPTVLKDLRLSDLFNGQGQFLSYNGGLTTPTCLEMVTWVVMTDVKSITQGTLDKFKQASVNPPSTAEMISLYGNFRPIQPLGNRVIYASDSANVGPACGAVSNPVFNCSGTSPTASPSPRPASGAAAQLVSPLILLFSLSAVMLSAL